MLRPARRKNPPTGPMVRMLRRIAKGERVPVVAPDPAALGIPRILLGMVARRLIEPDGEGGQRVYSLTPDGRSVIADSRSTAWREGGG